MNRWDRIQRRKWKEDQEKQQDETLFPQSVRTELNSLGSGIQLAFQNVFGKLEFAKETEHPQAFYKKDVPLKPYIPALIEYAKKGQLDIQVGGVAIASVKLIKLRPTSDYLELEYSLNGAKSTYKVDYLNDKLRSFFLGQWVVFGGLLEVKCNPNTITPVFVYDETVSAASIKWSEGPLMKVKKLHWFQNITDVLWATKAQLQGILVSPTEGQVYVKGLIGYFVPDLRWV